MHVHPHHLKHFHQQGVKEMTPHFEDVTHLDETAAPTMPPSLQAKSPFGKKTASNFFPPS
jgi:hypothetical protein